MADFLWFSDTRWARPARTDATPLAERDFFNTIGAMPAIRLCPTGPDSGMCSRATRRP